MRILVTGGNGFLGSAFIRKLLLDNHSVYAFSKNKNNLEDILDLISFDHAHTSELFLFQEKVKEFSPDIVVHFGWSGGNNYTDVNQIEQFYENVPCGIQFIEFLKTLDKKPKFIGIGSFSEYGKIEFQIDETSFENPINLYGVSKLAFKNYSKILCDNYLIDWTWVRPCYVYGPGDVRTRLIPILINKFIQNDKVELDECNKIIDYLYIDDFIDLLYELMISKSTGVYNICSGEQYNLKNIIEKIHSTLKSCSEIIYNRDLNRKLTSSYICGSNNKIITTTGLRPKIDLENGLSKTINYYKNIYETVNYY